MKMRVLIVVTALLLAAGGFTVAQQQSTTPYFPEAPGVGLVAPMPLTVLTPVAKEVKPEDLTIDQLIDEVSKIREEKAKLAKKEDLYLKTMTNKAAKQKERIDSLLGLPKAADDSARIPSINLPIPERNAAPKQP